MKERYIAYLMNSACYGRDEIENLSEEELKGLIEQMGEMNRFNISLRFLTACENV